MQTRAKKEWLECKKEFHFSSKQCNMCIVLGIMAYPIISKGFDIAINTMTVLLTLLKTRHIINYQDQRETKQKSK